MYYLFLNLKLVYKESKINNKFSYLKIIPIQIFTR